MDVFVFNDWYYNGAQVHQKAQKKDLSDAKSIKKGAQTHKAHSLWRAAAPLFPMWGTSLAATVLGKKKKVGLCVMEHTLTVWINRVDLTHTSHFQEWISMR